MASKAEERVYGLLHCTRDDDNRKWGPAPGHDPIDDNPRPEQAAAPSGPAGVARQGLAGRRTGRGLPAAAVQGGAGA